VEGVWRGAWQEDLARGDFGRLAFGDDAAKCGPWAVGLGLYQRRVVAAMYLILSSSMSKDAGVYTGCALLPFLLV